MDLVSLFKMFLEKEGHKVEGFSDPYLALDYFKKISKNLALLITGLRMPGMNGIDLVKSVKLLNKDIKIIMMTNFDIRDLEQYPRYKAARIDKLLQKPVRFVGLKKMINDTLDPTKEYSHSILMDFYIPILWQDDDDLLNAV